MHMSGVKLPALGSLKDRIFRDFQVHESRLRMKQQQLQLNIALLNTSDAESRKVLLDIWKEIIRLEFGLEVQEGEAELDRDMAMMMEFEAAKKLDVKLEVVNTGKEPGLKVTGLK